MKMKILMQYLRESQTFGEIIAEVSVTEFQNRGLVHVHIILFLAKQSELHLEDPLNIDGIISEEIHAKIDPMLLDAALLHMIHRPCDRLNEVQC